MTRNISRVDVTLVTSFFKNNTRIFSFQYCVNEILSDTMKWKNKPSYTSNVKKSLGKEQQHSFSVRTCKLWYDTYIYIYPIHKFTSPGEMNFLCEFRARMQRANIILSRRLRNINIRFSCKELQYKLDRFCNYIDINIQSNPHKGALLAKI